MSEFKFCSASASDDRNAWLQAWSHGTEREPFAHPSYVTLFARPDDEACCASLRSRHGTVLFPLVVRSIAAEPWGKARAPVTSRARMGTAAPTRKVSAIDSLESSGPRSTAGRVRAGS